MSEVIRIANCSGFYGDRLAAAIEMVKGGSIDVLTGDYLAELTMAILHEQRSKRGSHLGYVGTFLKQVKEVAAECAERDIKIVVNAGGLNPKGMAEETSKILSEIGVDLQVAYIDGDDITDEFMFNDLPSHAVNVKVGKKNTQANYCIDKPHDVISLLNALTS